MQKVALEISKSSLLWKIANVVRCSQEHVDGKPPKTK